MYKQNANETMMNELRQEHDLETGEGGSLSAPAIKKNRYRRLTKKILTAGDI
jgi:hypothetical protein